MFGSSTFSLESLTGLFGWNPLPGGKPDGSRGSSAATTPGKPARVIAPRRVCQSLRAWSDSGIPPGCMGWARQPGVASLDPRLPSIIPPGMNTRGRFFRSIENIEERIFSVRDMQHSVDCQNENTLLHRAQLVAN